MGSTRGSAESRENTGNLPRMDLGVRDFVVAGAPFVGLLKPGDLDEATRARLNAVYVITLVTETNI